MKKILLTGLCLGLLAGCSSIAKKEKEEADILIEKLRQARENKKKKEDKEYIVIPLPSQSK